MIFGRKKGMIDIRELQRRGVVRIPKQDIIIPTDKSGFIELGIKSKPILKNPATAPSSSGFIDFFGNSSSTAVPSPQGSRMESERMIELDNKIYKLEQRIELLERKLDINRSNDTNSSIIGW